VIGAPKLYAELFAWPSLSLAAATASSRANEVLPFIRAPEEWIPERERMQQTREGRRLVRRISIAPQVLVLAVSLSCEVLLLSPPTQASVGDFLTDVGRALGKPFGGFVESLVTPSLRAVDDRLVSSVDRRLGERIEQVNRSASGLLDRTDELLGKTVNQVDTVVANRLSQADGIMAARIAQIGVTGNQLLDNAIGKLDGTLDKNIRLVGTMVRATVNQLNDVSKRRVAQIDGVLAVRIDQLQGAVQESIADVDRAIEQRLEQVDEISERRVGNLDVVGTRQILNLEGALTRLASLFATLALVVLTLVRLGQELWERWEQAPADRRFLARVWAITDLRLLASFFRVVIAHATIFAILFGVLQYFARRPSAEVTTRLKALHALYDTGFRSSEQALDYRGALYNASQLAILEPERAAVLSVRVTKLKLMRDVLGRSALFERPETARNLARNVATLNAQIEAQTRKQDPDLLTLQCYIRWQLAADRPSEGVAAADCSRALTIAGEQKDAGTFLLARLAQHYVARHSAFPSWGTSAELQPESPEPLPGFEHVHAYDDLVTALDAASTSAYVELLAAQVEVERLLRERRSGTASPRKPAPTASARTAADARAQQISDAKGARLTAARSVVAAWKAFDEALLKNEWISGTNSELAVFLLNDAILTRALYVVAAPEADELPAKIKDIADPLLRMRVVPPRVEWMRRYLGWLGDDARRLATFEESERFSSFEDEVIAFERAFVELRLASAPEAALHARAARAAAQLALYVTANGRRAPLAQDLLGTVAIDDDVHEEIESLANTRRLRLL
jgi:hypothetical protein